MLMNIATRINRVLQDIRPYLKEDGGDVEFVSYDDLAGIVYVRFQGNCVNCPISIMTLRAGIERYILSEVPGVRRIEQII